MFYEVKYQQEYFEVFIISIKSFWLTVKKILCYFFFLFCNNFILFVYWNVYIPFPVQS